MPNILLRSSENINAAQKLIDIGHYTSSIHCSYYSVLQMMKHILHHKCSISYSSQNDGTGLLSHDNICTKIYHAGNTQAFRRDFRVTFNNLKSKRKKADYENSDLFSDIESLNVKEKSDKLISKLKSEFQIR